MEELQKLEAAEAEAAAAAAAPEPEPEPASQPGEANAGMEEAPAGAEEAPIEHSVHCVNGPEGGEIPAAAEAPAEGES